jgi:hypothetical protein
MDNRGNTMNISKRLATFAACAALSSGALAQKTVEQAVKDAQATNFDYTWLEVNYVTTDAGSRDPDGLRVKGSFAIAQPFSVIGSVAMYSDGPLDIFQLSGGASYHLNIGSLSGVEALDKMDGVAYAEMQYLDVSVDNCRGCDDDDLGIKIGGEARYQVIDQLEAYVDVSLSTTEVGRGSASYGNDFAIGTGVRYSPIDLLALTAGVTFADDDELYLGARFNF